jgi:hypothetical protein
MYAEDTTEQSGPNLELERLEISFSDDKCDFPMSDPAANSQAQVESAPESGAVADSSTFAAAGAPEVPLESPESRVVLMPVEPETAHVYWEIAPDVPKEDQAVLRVYEVTGAAPSEAGEQAFRDIVVNTADKRQYISALHPGRSYCIDLGFKKADGSFMTLAHSQTASMPVASPFPANEQSFEIGSPANLAERPRPDPRATASPQILALSPAYREAEGSLSDQPANLADLPLWAKSLPALPGLHWSPSGFERDEIERSRAIDSFERSIRGIPPPGQLQTTAFATLEPAGQLGKTAIPEQVRDLTDISEECFLSGGGVSS